MKQQSMFLEGSFVLERHGKHVVAWLKKSCCVNQSKGDDEM